MNVDFIHSNLLRSISFQQKAQDISTAACSQSHQLRQQLMTICYVISSVTYNNIIMYYSSRYYIAVVTF